MKTICVVTGSRADYSLLYWLMRDLADDRDFRLQVAVTGMHLSPEFGETWRVIDADGFAIDARVETLLSSDTAQGVAKSTGLGVIGFADAFAHLRPDIVVLLGDRFEILAAAQAALIAKLPVAHLCGGDITEGAFDDAIRHSITKMAHLHFVTNEPAARRVRQLGEDPKYIFNVGSPGIDNIKRVRLLERTEIERQLAMRFRARNLLVTFHPATLDLQPAPAQLEELLRGLDAIGPAVGVVATKSNADPEGRRLNQMLEQYAAERDNCYCFDSLGPQLYLSVMAQVDGVIGNSSSGLYEAPSLKRPTVNIGDRQKGRLRAASVIDCAPDASAIERAIRAAFELDCSQVSNPYGNGNSVQRIVQVLKTIPDSQALIRKRFVDA